MKNQVFWKMKNGQVINVDDMTETHAKNTLKMVLRRVDAWEKAIAQSKPRFEVTGEIAQETAEMAYLHSIDPELTCCCDEFHICQQCVGS